MPVDPVRDAAVDVLLRVFDKGVFLGLAIDKTLRRKNLSRRGMRFMTQLVYGTVRHKLLCDHILAGLVSQPLAQLPAPILLVLRMGVFQSLFCNQVTFPAMVHTSVDLAKKRGHIGTSRLVNAVLRRAPQSLDDVDLPSRESAPAEFLSLRYSTPQWLVETWIEDYAFPETESLCEALNSEAPRTARVNTCLITLDRLLAALNKAGTPAVPHPDVPEAITFTEGAIPISGKAFQNGHFFIQDPASMLAPHLLEPQPGECVLDLCAAPGGKTTHLAQLAEGKALVVGMDLHPAKLELLRENVERLGLSGIAPVAADGLRPPFAAGFDRVLVDAPCTGLGTLRRHPDITWRLHRGDSERLAGQQRDLLRSAIGLCKNGGLIVYSVCTFARQETEEVIQSILEDGNVTLEEGPEWLNTWKISPGQYRIHPRIGQLDGYFLTRLRKAF